MDYYRTLEIDYEATREEIRASYLRLVQENHPDRRNVDSVDDAGSKESFKRIQEAYEVLYSQQRRAEYDRAQRRPPPVRAVHLAHGPVARDLPVHWLRRAKKRRRSKAWRFLFFGLALVAFVAVVLSLRVLFLLPGTSRTELSRATQEITIAAAAASTDEERRSVPAEQPAGETQNQRSSQAPPRTEETAVGRSSTTDQPWLNTELSEQLLRSDLEPFSQVPNGVHERTGPTNPLLPTSDGIMIPSYAETDSTFDPQGMTVHAAFVPDGSPPIVQSSFGLPIVRSPTDRLAGQPRTLPGSHGNSATGPTRPKKPSRRGSARHMGRTWNELQSPARNRQFHPSVPSPKFLPKSYPLMPSTGPSEPDTDAAEPPAPRSFGTAPGILAGEAPRDDQTHPFGSSFDSAWERPTTGIHTPKEVPAPFYESSSSAEWDLDDYFN